MEHLYYISFIDIIGFKHAIENDLITFEQLENMKNHIENIPLIKNELLKYTSLSDTIILSIPQQGDFNNALSILNLLLNTAIIQCYLLRLGFLSKGSITIGEFQNKEGILFGKGLVRSASLEKKAAIYPRVIIDEPILYEIRSNRDKKPTMRNTLFETQDTRVDRLFKQLSELELSKEYEENKVELGKLYEKFENSAPMDPVSLIKLSTAVLFKSIFIYTLDVVPILKDFDNKYYLDYLNWIYIYEKNKINLKDTIDLDCNANELLRGFFNKFLEMLEAHVNNESIFFKHYWFINYLKNKMTEFDIANNHKFPTISPYPLCENMKNYSYENLRDELI